jgi:hypothetical protein
LGRLFEMMGQYDMVDWDGDAFEDLFEHRVDAQDVFEVFHALFEGLTHEAVLEAFMIQTEVTFNRQGEGGCA